MTILYKRQDSGAIKHLYLQYILLFWNFVNFLLPLFPDHCLFFLNLKTFYIAYLSCAISNISRIVMMIPHLGWGRGEKILKGRISTLLERASVNNIYRNKETATLESIGRNRKSNIGTSQNWTSNKLSKINDFNKTYKRQEEKYILMKLGETKLKIGTSRSWGLWKIWW